MYIGRFVKFCAPVTHTCMPKPKPANTCASCRCVYVMFLTHIHNQYSCVVCYDCAPVSRSDSVMISPKKNRPGNAHAQRNSQNEMLQQDKNKRWMNKTKFCRDQQWLLFASISAVQMPWLARIMQRHDKMVFYIDNVCFCAQETSL
jgi:hypothetical protein